MFTTEIIALLYFFYIILNQYENMVVFPPLFNSIIAVLFMNPIVLLCNMFTPLDIINLSFVYLSVSTIVFLLLFDNVVNYYKQIIYNNMYNNIYIYLVPVLTMICVWCIANLKSDYGLLLLVLFLRFKMYMIYEDLYNDNSIHERLNDYFDSLYYNPSYHDTDKLYVKLNEIFWYFMFILYLYKLTNFMSLQYMMFALVTNYIIHSINFHYVVFYKYNI